LRQIVAVHSRTVGLPHLQKTSKFVSIRPGDTLLDTNRANLLMVRLLMETLCDISRLLN
jgi:hypothetical protein